MTLTVDPTAPTGLPEELSRKVSSGKRAIKLTNRSKDLTRHIRDRFRFVKHAPRDDPLVKEKVAVDAALHREKSNRRNRMKEKVRKRHFRTADTAILEAQLRLLWP